MSLQIMPDKMGCLIKKINGYLPHSESEHYPLDTYFTSFPHTTKVKMFLEIFQFFLWLIKLMFIRPT